MDRGMGCFRGTEQVLVYMGRAVICPVETKNNNNNRLRPRGWPGMGVSLGWLPTCRMVPPPQALHSYQSGAPSDSCFLSGCPSRSGHHSAQAF